MYDDGLNLNISLPKKNSKHMEELDLSDPQNYFTQNGPALFDRLNEILEDVDLVHKVIKQCVTDEELDKVQEQEDQTVIDYNVRVTFQKSEFKGEKN